MESIEKFQSEPDRCEYLPAQIWQFDYDIVSQLSKEECSSLIRKGWRKFGAGLFRPVCRSCKACQPVRVRVADFVPSRAQKRTARANQDIRVEIGESHVSTESLILCLRHHESRSADVGWRTPTLDSSVSLLASICSGPLKSQEWRFYLGPTLVAVGYVDSLTDGYSAVYSFYDPELTRRSLGTQIILTIIDRARQEGLPFVYLGYYIKDCRSMRYKALFRPNEVLGEDGDWHLFHHAGYHAGE